jgi:hypothetical protein
MTIAGAIIFGFFAPVGLGLFALTVAAIAVLWLWVVDTIQKAPHTYEK